MSAEQPDGSYPRLNGSLLQSCQHAGTIVSLVGKIEMYDGQSINIKCADGVIAKVVCEADAEIQQGSIYELVGLANDDGTLQVRTRVVWNEHRAEIQVQVHQKLQS